MTKKEFIDEIMLQVASSLPPSYGDAGMKLQEVKGFNDTSYQALLIQRDGEMITPSINLDSLYEKYQQGHSIEDLAHEIVVIKMTDNVVLENLNLSIFHDYENVRDKLDIRVCDRELNPSHLENLVQKDYGDLTATYRIILGEANGGMMSTPVTKDMMESWGVTPEQIHEDATYQMQPKLYRMEDILDSLLAGQEPDNLLESPVSSINEFYPGIPMYIVTNDKGMNGASVILDPEVMKQVCEVVGSGGFLLPSSIHECIFLPDDDSLDVKELLNMVNEVNTEVVDNRDILSDKVQHCDKETGLFINAELWVQQQLDKTKTPEVSQSLDQMIKEQLKDNPARKAPKGPSL